MVGLQAERAGLIKKGAQFVSAVSTSRVPHISIICGASYGAGNYAMCGRSYKPRFLFTWPTGRCSVMGPDQLSGVMEEIHRGSAKRDGREISEAKLQASVKGFRDEVQRDSDPYRTSAYVLDDGVIEPGETRDVLGMCLEVVQMAPVAEGSEFRVLARM
jgi:acetyl-CoA carboxylase carboxyltransferase component